MKSIFKFILSASILASSFATADESPSLSLSISNPLKSEPVQTEVVPVSNVTKVEATLTLGKKGTDRLFPLPEVPVNPAEAGSMSQYITIKISDFATGNIVPVKASGGRVILEDGKEMIKVSFEIPETPETRLTKIQSTVDQMTTEQAAIPGEESEAIVAELGEKKAEIVAALEAIYTENRVGKFKVVAQYHSAAPAAWTGSGASPDVVVEVKNKGSFRDTLKK